jgi:serine/threonine-protein kinase HipA
MIAKTARAAVRLHHIHVGELTYSQGASAFRYDDDVASPDHGVLGQIFEDEPGASREARVGLPAWFANLLPEGARADMSNARSVLAE